MNPNPFIRILSVCTACLLLASCTAPPKQQPTSQSKLTLSGIDLAQVPTWTPPDLDFFLHGSMGAEVVPESVLRAFIKAYPDLFPTEDLSHLGAIPDPAFGWPIGFSRKPVAHLGGLSAVGINCSSCHVGDVVSAPGAPPLRVLGMTSHFDVEGFYGAVIVSTFRTSDPANMKKFLGAWLSVNDPSGGAAAQDRFAAEWQQQEEKITAAISADPFGAKGVAAGGLYRISRSELRLDSKSFADGADLSALAHSTIELFHNMRAAVHFPDQPPTEAPPASGPGRNNAFSLLSAALLGMPRPYAPVKFGLVWNVENRYWVHWDGNTRSPLGRNLLASLGLGAPMIGKHGELDFASVQRQTDLGERIRPPRYPLAIDDAAAKRGAALYQARCATCHDGPESDARLHAPDEVGTDPVRATNFVPEEAEGFNKFLAEVEIPGYRPGEPGIRSTQKYWAASLQGVWARSPYLHNGSVRTMQDLLTAPDARPKTFHRGSRAYDASLMGYADDGTYVFDTTSPGNANTGHSYGTDLSSDQKHELMEYLKTL